MVAGHRSRFEARRPAPRRVARPAPAQALAAAYRSKRALFAASMLGGMVVAAGAIAGPVLPMGGTVAAGSAAISHPSASSLTVSQTSSKAIIDWTSFSIGQGATVQFDNGSGATLNRVTGTGVSSIDGLLSATGSVYLINANGVIVGKTGVIDTGGSFVASTLDVGNASFLAGGPLTFAGNSSASVVNLGKVSSLGGNVAMIAATVSNAGSIAAPKGDVGLIAGTTVTMDDADNDAGGLFSVQVGDGSTSATNTGAIAAAAVELRAQQGNVYALAGNTGGVIDATGIAASGGTIKLISTGGTATVTGTLEAQGPNGSGGQIETSGETLDLGAATVNTHGGSWLLDPTNLIVDSTAAGVIDNALSSGDVTLATSAGAAPTGPAGSTGNTASGAGDILVESPITWSTGSTLTLDAYASLIVSAPITVTGGGKVVLDFNTAAADAPGGLSFDLGPTGFGGSLSFASGQSGQALTINGQAYALLYSMSDVAGINGMSGDYALAAPIAGGSYGAAVAASFSGTLEGAGERHQRPDHHGLQQQRRRDRNAEQRRAGARCRARRGRGLGGQRRRRAGWKEPRHGGDELHDRYGLGSQRGRGAGRLELRHGGDELRHRGGFGRKLRRRTGRGKLRWDRVELRHRLSHGHERVGRWTGRGQRRPD
jgi:filamentous hemagglutinin family protein